MGNKSNLGSYQTFVSDGRTQHVISLLAFDDKEQRFTYDDTAGDQGLLASGNNVAGVAAVKISNAVWKVTRDELQRVLYAITVTPGDILTINRSMVLGPFGQWGTSVADAQKTDFFTYFRLKQVARAGGAEHQQVVLTFKSEYAKLAPVVTVRLYVNGDGLLTDAELALKRKFIDDPKNELAARDIAQSFLTGAATAQDQEAVHRLHDEIMYLSSRPIVVGGAANIKIPLIPTDGFLAFKGRRSYFTQMLSRSRLWMENVVEDGEPALLMAVGTAE
jgi:hypothetical protein